MQRAANTGSISRKNPAQFRVAVLFTINSQTEGLETGSELLRMYLSQAPLSDGRHKLLLQLLGRNSPIYVASEMRLERS